EAAVRRHPALAPNAAPARRPGPDPTGVREPVPLVRDLLGRAPHDAGGVSFARYRMNVLTYGEIMDGGASVFHCVAREDDGSFFLTFSGVVRIDNPYRFLQAMLQDLREILPKRPITRSTLDFTELEFCNS